MTQPGRHWPRPEKAGPRAGGPGGAHPDVRGAPFSPVLGWLLLTELLTLGRHPGAQHPHVSGPRPRVAQRRACRGGVKRAVSQEDLAWRPGRAQRT